METTLKWTFPLLAAGAIVVEVWFVAGSPEGRGPAVVEFVVDPGGGEKKSPNRALTAPSSRSLIDSILSQALICRLFCLNKLIVDRLGSNINKEVSITSLTVLINDYIEGNNTTSYAVSRNLHNDHTFNVHRFTL